MFDRNKPVRFDPYRGRRPRRGLPRWLWLLMVGVVAGAAGAVWVQERVLPPRLSSGESAALRSAFEGAESERARLAAELAAAEGRITALTQQQNVLTQDLASARTVASRREADAATLLAALPPDPRQGAVAVRAARFVGTAGSMSYEVVLSREASKATPLAGWMQLVVTGEPSAAGARTVSPEPIALSMGRHEIARGSVVLPAGFRPRQTTVQVLDASRRKLLGMRVLMVP
jgi:hypothetical protein